MAMAPVVGDSAMAALDGALRDAFPAVDFRMAYGSGVFAQKDHDTSTSMIDLVFAVEDPRAWHAVNIERNPSHYSFLRCFGADNVASFQETYGAGVYYNTLVPLQCPTLGNRLIKYGVVRSDTLCQDLRDWRTLYLSGRMHKPVSIMASTETIDAAASQNLQHALDYALLCLPEKFDERDLYMRIAGISYLGDFRMTFGENPKKVRNIVEGNMVAFQQLYRNKLVTSPLLQRQNDGSILSGAHDASSQRVLLGRLPSNVARKLPDGFQTTTHSQKDVKKHVQRAVASIVNRYSRSQSIKGILTAGAAKSITYVAQKLGRTYFRAKSKAR
ncbi:TPA: hypothetical protein N0F65_011778 [Lagenidium giganteum]|uniref:Phosphatidate cytidylyltransferase, mitochondrial n=1 Tax=Lagenidium giganteum TaxID=4803 RepID=A0AAV2YJU8_9STRA|nr:TPA: hypothetical protein N0F65_011778 [Lagenidium giganteum]